MEINGNEIQVQATAGHTNRKDGLGIDGKEMGR